MHVNGSATGGLRTQPRLAALGGAMVGAAATLAILLAMGQLEATSAAVLSSQGAATPGQGLLEYRQGERGAAVEARPALFVLTDHRRGEIGAGLAAPAATERFHDEVRSFLRRAVTGAATPGGRWADLHARPATQMGFWADRHAR